MKVVIINNSDNRGGAAIAAVRLLHALNEGGVEARMLVVHADLKDEPAIARLKPAARASMAFLCECADIYMHNGMNRADLFKVSIASCGMNVSEHPWVKEADVVNLHWVNQGTLSLSEIARIKAPVVWTMHDMWCMTGVCHHAHECIGYLRQCGNCNLLHGASAENDLSRSTLRRKRELYSRKPIHFVAVSHWLEGCARKSSLLKQAMMQVIHNAFPDHLFSLTPSKGRHHYNLPASRPLIVMGAARLDDPIKGLDLAVEALNKLTDTDAAAVFYGNLRDKHALDGLQLPYVYLGPVYDPAAISDIYAHAKIVLSTAHYENLPTTLIEGMAAGCFPVAYDRGGQRDIFDHMRTGYLATYPNVDNIVAGLRYVLKLDVDRQRQRNTVIERFNAAEVARQYITLFNSLLT